MTRDEQGRLLLVRSSNRSNFPGVWFLPGGGLDHGEDPAAGLRREFMEETGLEVEITGLREVTADLVEFPFREVLLHHDRIIYDVRVSGGSLTVETAGTTDLPDWVEPDRLPDLELVPFAARTLGLATADSNEVNQRPAAPDEAGEFGSDGWALGGAQRVVRFGAYGVVTDPAGRVLLSLIAQGYPGGGRWHLPGGGTDFGEQPAAGLVREIFEESGQVGVVAGAIAVGSHHNRTAMGPEGKPIDWYGIRAVFDVTVDQPTPPVVTEAAGGSTAAACWFTRDELRTVPLTELAYRALLAID